MVPYRGRSREGAGRCELSVLGGCVATRPVPLREPGGQAIAPRQEETGNRCGPEPGMVPYRDRSREGAGRCEFSVLGGCVATRPVPLREPGGQAIAPRQEETVSPCRRVGRGT